MDGLRALEGQWRNGRFDQSCQYIVAPYTERQKDSLEHMRLAVIESRTRVADRSAAHISACREAEGGRGTLVFSREHDTCDRVREADQTESPESFTVRRAHSTCTTTCTCACAGELQ